MTTCELSARELRRLIGARELSPLELLDDCIARIAALDPAVNAFCQTDFERARAAARAAGEAVVRGGPLGPLHGLPVGVKDLEDTAGLRTTLGSIAHRHRVPARDALIVERLKAAGALVAAKTNTPDHGAGANTRNAVWGATGNPFDPSRNAGGSSGGSAVALALDLLPLCTGSDLGGSLRIPAAYCGVVGLRPSPGRVPSSDKRMPFSPVWTSGPMARDVADLAFALAALAGPDARDPLSLPEAGATLWPLPEADPAALRIGFSEDLGCCAVDDDIRRVFRRRVQALSRLVARCEPVAPDLADAHRAFDVLRAEDFLATFGDAGGEQLSPAIQANLEAARRYGLADAAWARQAQQAVGRRLQALFADFDLVVTPTVAVSPFPWTQPWATRVGGQDLPNYYRWLAPTYVLSVTGHPALSLPCGRDEAGMPFGLQLIGPWRGDAGLLAAAQALERAFAADAETARPRPDLAALRQARPELRSIVTHPPAAPT